MSAPSTELPPTAGLPLRWHDFLPGGEPLGKTLAGLFGTPEMQLECSGTAALWVALRTLQRLHPDRSVVVIPAYTCPLVAIVVHTLGLELRLCDLLPGQLDMDPMQLARLCDARTLAVLPTHLGGRVADVTTARTIAHRHGAHVIEDAAQALGAFSQGGSVGLRADIVFFSLAAGKGLSLYEGGLLFSNNPGLQRELRSTSHREIGRQWRLELLRCAQLLGLAICYRPRLLPYVYGRPQRAALAAGNMEEAVGDVFPLQVPRHQVSRWRQNIGHRAAARLPALLHSGRERAAHWRARLSHLPNLRVLGDRPGDEGVWPVLLLYFDNPDHRDAVLRRLWTQRLGVSCMFVHALPDYAYLQPLFTDDDTVMPNARAFAERTLTIGNSAWLDEPSFKRILAVLQNVLAVDS